MKTHPKCPRCCAAPIGFTELWSGHTIYFDSDGGKIDHGGVQKEGDPYGVVALCACGRRWRLRGVMQIIDVPGHPDHVPNGRKS